MATPLELVLQAVATLQSPASSVQHRREASLLLEQAKNGDKHVLLSVAGSLIDAQLPTEARIVGFTLLTEMVRNRWSELLDDEKSQISQLSYQQTIAVCAEGRAARPLKGKSAVLLAAVIRQQGASAYNLIVPQLIQQATEGPAQAELACLVLHYISEDITFEGGTSGEAKRLFLAALTASVSSVFPFLCETLQQHFMLAVDAQKQSAADALANHSAVIQAALGALSAWVEWTPMQHISSSNVLDACAFFITTPEFRLPALDVLKQIVMRKRTTEAWQEYAALMDGVATRVVARSSELGLLVAPGQLKPDLSSELDYGGDLEELGRRICGLVVWLCENHLRCLTLQERRLQLLQLLLMFTAHPYLKYPEMTLPVWTQLTREALPGYNTSTGNNAALHGLTATAWAEVLGPDVKHGSPPPLDIPPECGQALLRCMWEILVKVVILGEGGSSSLGGSTSQDGSANGSSVSGRAAAGPASTVPPYFDSQQDWREFCISMRGQAKQAIRGCTQLFPQPSLTFVSQALQQAVANATAACASAAATQQINTAMLAFDCAIHVAEAVIPQVTEHFTTQPALLEAVVVLLQGLMACRFTVPKLVTLHARCLEAFCKVLILRHDLAAPLVRTALEAMTTIPLDANGKAPPPARITREWKAKSEARLSMANAVTQFAKAAPPAFAPHLRALADQTTLMYDAGSLTEGERVLLWEGLLAAAAGVSTELSSQLAGWLLAPIAAAWTSQEWRARLVSPQAFLQAFAPVEVPASTTTQMVLGARSERWALYHQVTLLERAMRRTAPMNAVISTNSGTTTDGRAASPPLLAKTAVNHPNHPAPDYPMNTHLGWCLPSVAALLQCVHGTAAADAAGLLGPLQGLMALDDTEKVQRLVGEEMVAGTGGRDSKEPRCVAGGHLLDVRYLLRGLRESCSMVLSLAALHGSIAALWTDNNLATTITAATTSNLESLDHNHVRLLIRHVVTQYSSRCPAPYQPMWLLPLLSVFLPHLAHRLSNAWAASSANISSGGAVQSVSTSARTSGSGARSQQEVDEVVGDVMLRELTREHMQLLVQLTLRPGEKPNEKSGLSVHTKKKGGSNSPTRQGSAGPNAISDASVSKTLKNGQGLSHASSSVSMADADGVSNASDTAAARTQDTLFDLLMGTKPELGMIMVRTAISGLCWPDSEAASKAILACRFLAAWGLREGGPVAEAVTGPLLQAAVVSLAQVSSVDVQGELLALLRLLLVNGLPQPIVGQQIRATMLGLLQVLSDFEAQLASKAAEKEQRALIRQLVVQAGGEEVRKILQAVAKLPSAPSAVKEGQRNPAKPKDPLKEDQDAQLQGAIYGVIFNE